MLNELKLYVHVCIYASAHAHTYNNNYGKYHEVEGGALGGRTLIWLHVHVWSGTIVSHWLPLAHCHLVLHRHALG